MVCYTIVLGTAIVVQGLRNKIQKALPHANVLFLLLWGGAIALVVDHLLNGELFLISANVLWDILLGTAMTIAILTIWTLYVIVSTCLSRAYKVRA